jgi:N-acetylneuraminic acid mutarotase
MRIRGPLALGISIALTATVLMVGPAHAATYSLMLSASPDRSSPVQLEGQTVSGNVYVFTTPATGVSRVRFWLDNPNMTGTPTKTENGAPHDFAGTASNGSANPYDTTKLADGPHSITASVDLSAGGSEVVTSSFTVSNGVANPYQLLVSSSPDRSLPVQLEGRTVSGNVYVFTTPATGVLRVRFWLDNPNMTGTPTKTENGAPHDFAGTASNGAANPFDTTKLPDGLHSITASVDLSAGGSQVLSGMFTVSNASAPSLVFSPTSLSFSLDEGGTAPSQTASLSTNSGGAAGFSVSDNAPWLSVSPVSGTTPANLTVSVAGSQLAPGTYTGSITANASGYNAATIGVTLEVGGGCSPLACSEVLIDLPYELDWGIDQGKILDGDGVGTGFTWIDDPSKGTGYIPGNLDVDLTAGTLDVTTTKGIAYQAVDSQDNALGVGIDAPSQVTLISTTVLNPPAGTGNSEQAGLWFGMDEDNHVKLVVLSTPTGTKIQYASEVAGQGKNVRTIAVPDLTSSRVFLQLRTDPNDTTITARYSINGGAQQDAGSFVAPPEFFSFDAAGIDPRIGTRSFGGILATHRKGPSPLVYRFDQFSVTAEDSAPPPGGGTGGADAISFTRSSHNVPSPTSMVWGPDGRLYVTELFGKIHALTFNAAKQVTNDQLITTLGSRLTLGITIDPASTPSNVILWVSHSNPSLNAGTPDSSTITRLSGANFTTRQDVITGLPRAVANHAVNSLHFGPGGKLYIAQGGNTGAGAPNTAGTEFGTFAEQPLSAALLVADVFATGFDGSCHNETNLFGPNPCDVQVYASGLRNTYDFVFHSNGHIYGPDNGLGVTGSFPPSPTPPCFGFGSTVSWTSGGNNPGRQPDFLNRIVQGKYYGHPNPTRDECVFGDGHYQNVPPLPNYQQPLFNLGNNRSANGTIEYQSSAFCGDLNGQILITNYSVGDDVTRVKLSPDGLSVVSADSLVAGFDDPLPIAQGPDGTIYVGEFGGSKVTALIPVDAGCWTSKQPAPSAFLDAGGGAIGGKLYVVAGKATAGPQSLMRVYDAATNTWSTGPSLPGPAVENPAAAVLNGKLYVFGGSTDPFSGAVTNAAVFDPSTNAWTALPAMPVARGGATAQAIGSKIYVIGGMNAAGDSLDSVSVFDTSTSSWGTAASMATRRDNPASAVFGGKLYVFGGRTRNADGTVPVNNLSTVEMYDPATNTWTFKASMPTGRRTMVVGVLNGRALVIGGERKADGTAFAANEEYDPITDAWRILKPLPTARHGAVAGTINGVVYVVGGASNAAVSSALSVNEAFAFGA